jgi:S1-C subfamily serine protease
MIEDGPGTPPEGSPEWTPPGAPPDSSSAWLPPADGSTVWPPAPLPSPRKSRLPYMIALAVAGVVVLLLATTAGVLALRPHPSHRSLLSVTQPSPPSPLPKACVSGRECPRLLLVERSVVKITSFAPSCHRTTIGTGFVYAPDQILTNAHVVAGAAPSRITVTDFTGTTRHATLVGYDPKRDVAVLEIPYLPLPNLDLATGSKIPSQAMTAGYTKKGLKVQGIGVILPPQNAVGRDIYQNDIVLRQVLRVRTVFEPGESGSPILNRDGQWVGLIFADALDIPGDGYALPLSELAPLALKALSATTPVSAQGCAD